MYAADSVSIILDALMDSFSFRQLDTVSYAWAVRPKTAVDSIVGVCVRKQLERMKSRTCVN